MFSTALAILAILPGLSGTSSLERHAFSEPHMGTLFRVVVFAPDEPTARAAARDAFARAAALNNVMSDYQATSELMRLCAKAGQGFVPVSQDLFQVLSRAQKVSRDSDGAFDVTIGPVIRLWRIARKSRTLPAPDRLLAARELVGWKNLELDEKTRSVRLLKPGMQLDLGGIGKGFAADEMLKVLAKHGLTRAMVVAGGDVTVADPPPGKPGWTIAIAPIDSRKEGPRYLVLANAAVSSSGDAEQHVEIDGVRYSHMVDPRTGVGLIGRMSATVVAPDGTTADSLTKVVAILGPDKGFPIIEKQRGAGARLVRKIDDRVEVTSSSRFPTLRESGESRVSP